MHNNCFAKLVKWSILFERSELKLFHRIDPYFFAFQNPISRVVLLVQHKVSQALKGLVFCRRDVTKRRIKKRPNFCRSLTTNFFPKILSIVITRTHSQKYDKLFVVVVVVVVVVIVIVEVVVLEGGDVL